MGKGQTCRFCENPESILIRETCCSGCSKIDDPYQPERLTPKGERIYRRSKDGVYEPLEAFTSDSPNSEHI